MLLQQLNYINRCIISNKGIEYTVKNLEYQDNVMCNLAINVKYTLKQLNEIVTEIKDYLQSDKIEIKTIENNKEYEIIFLEG